MDDDIIWREIPLFQKAILDTSKPNYSLGNATQNLLPQTKTSFELFSAP